MKQKINKRSNIPIQFPAFSSESSFLFLLSGVQIEMMFLMIIEVGFVRNKIPVINIHESQAQPQHQIDFSIQYFVTGING